MEQIQSKVNAYIKRTCINSVTSLLTEYKSGKILEVINGNLTAIESALNISASNLLRTSNVKYTGRLSTITNDNVRNLVHAAIDILNFMSDMHNYYATRLDAIYRNIN